MSGRVSRGRWLLHPGPGMRTTPGYRPVPLGAQISIIVYHGIEDRCQHSPVRATVGAKTVEHELSDGGVSDQMSPAQNLKVS